jgi:hypothetical protein
MIAGIGFVASLDDYGACGDVLGNSRGQWCVNVITIGTGRSRRILAWEIFSWGIFSGRTVVRASFVMVAIGGRTRATLLATVTFMSIMPVARAFMMGVWSFAPLRGAMMSGTFCMLMSASLHGGRYVTIIASMSLIF